MRQTTWPAEFIVQWLLLPQFALLYSPEDGSPWYNRHGWLGVKNQLSIYLSIRRRSVAAHMVMGTLKTVAHAILSPYGLHLYLYMYACGCTYRVTLRVHVQLRNIYNNFSLLNRNYNYGGVFACVFFALQKVRKTWVWNVNVSSPKLDNFHIIYVIKSEIMDS